ncbi:8838_t:CDS:2, partial [Racocetra persica]
QGCKGIDTESPRFYNIFSVTTNDQFEDCIVQVFLRKPPENWVYIEEGLEGDILMLFELNFTHIKFVLEAVETSVQESFCQNLNAFDLLMKNSQNIHLPELKKENTCRDLLYNNIIRLFQNKEYQQNLNYNLFYDTGKHAKSNLKHDKLEQLASSLELSVVQP